MDEEVILIPIDAPPPEAVFDLTVLVDHHLVVTVALTLRKAIVLSAKDAGCVKTVTLKDPEGGELQTERATSRSNMSAKEKEREQDPDPRATLSATEEEKREDETVLQVTLDSLTQPDRREAVPNI